MGNDLDRRFGTVELEERAGQEFPAVTGYAAVFYNPNDPGTQFDMRQDGRIYERVLHGAFDGVEQADVLALYEHDRANLLGRTTAGTLRLSLDTRGLRYHLTPPATQLGRQITESIRRGDLRNSSFGFRVPPGGDNWRHDGSATVREIRRADVREISLVAFAAYGSANSELTARSLNHYAAAPPLGLLKRRLALLSRR